MLKAAVIAVMLVGLAAQAQADEDPAAQASRWTDLKHSLFGDKTVIEGSNVIALEAPARALDAATVPISVTLPGNGEHMSGRIKTVWIVVDGNPSPVAGAFHFGPDAVLHTLKTRVRVEQYTLIHAVAETEDGRLFSAARYVKGAGGCAAPSTKDPKVAMSRLGQMKVRLADNAVAAEGEAVTVKLLISHPNNNGMQMDQLTHYYIPPRYIQDIAVHYGKSLVMNVDTDISLSQDPVFTFGLRLQGNGPLHVDMEDSTHAKFHQDFDLVRGS